MRGCERIRGLIHREFTLQLFVPTFAPARWMRLLLKSLGPGVITGAADDDPSGIATYSVAGAQLGTKLLWTALLTWPLMAAFKSCVPESAPASVRLDGSDQGSTYHTDLMAEQLAGGGMPTSPASAISSRPCPHAQICVAATLELHPLSAPILGADGQLLQMEEMLSEGMREQGISDRAAFTTLYGKIADISFALPKRPT